MPSLNFAQRKAKNVLKLLVGIKHHIVFIDDHDAHRRVFKELLEPGLLYQNLLCRALALSHIIRQNQLRGPAGKIELVPANFDIDDTAVFLSVPRCAGNISEVSDGRRQGRHQVIDIFWGPNIFDRHLEKFFSCIPVMTNGRVVDRQEAQRFHVKDPHRQRIAFKEQPIIALGLK